jgi:hypothetical protein
MLANVEDAPWTACRLAPGPDHALSGSQTSIVNERVELKRLSLTSARNTFAPLNHST